MQISFIINDNKHNDINKPIINRIYESKNTDTVSKPRNKTNDTIKEVASNIFRNLIRPFFSFVFVSFWASLFSDINAIFPWGKVSLTPKQKESLKDPKIIDATRAAVIKKIKNKKALGSDVFIEYKKYLENTYKGLYVDLQYVPEFERIKLQSEEENLKRDAFLKSLNKKFLAIPFIIKKQNCLSKDHIALILVDYESGTIEYYDSKGLIDTDRKNQKLKLLPDDKKNIKIPDFLNDKIKELGLKGFTLIKHTYQNQYDRHNCGVFVLNYIEKRVKYKANLKTLKEKYKLYKTCCCKINTKSRKKLINNLFKYYKKHSLKQYKDLKITKTEKKDGFEEDWNIIN